MCLRALWAAPGVHSAPVERGSLAEVLAVPDAPGFLLLEAVEEQQTSPVVVQVKAVLAATVLLGIAKARARKSHVC